MSTITTLDMTRHAVRETFGSFPNDSTIWTAIWNKDVSRPIRSFLYKALHKAQKVGDYWKHIKSAEQRATCHICGVEESLDHILTDCDIKGQKLIWSLAKELWLKKNIHWPEIRNTGCIAAATMADFKSPGGKKLGGDNRLYRILITESAWLIWKLRNERQVQGKPREEWPNEDEIRNRWIDSINSRLALDCAMTSTKYGKKSLSTKRVLSTWRYTLHNEKSLPQDWSKHHGVLVGIRKRERRRGRRADGDPPDSQGSFTGAPH